MAFSTEPDGGAGKEGKDDDFEHLDYQWGLEEELGSQKPDPTAATKSEKLRDDEEILPHDSGKARWGSIPLYPVRSENGETKLIPICSGRPLRPSRGGPEGRALAGVSLPL